MASEAKKVRVFEPTALSKEEKTVAIKLGKLHHFHEFTPRYKFYFLRQFMIGLAVIVDLMNANRYDMIYLILKYLTSREFISLASCCDDRLMKEFWYPRNVIFKKFMKTYEKKDQMYHYYPASAALENIKTGQDLLRTYKLLQVPELYWKIDTSRVLPNQTIDCIAFNVKFPLIGLIMGNKLYVIAYGGEVRAKKGQILFASTSNVTFFGINWSPSGEYLLALKGHEEVQISLFFYDAKNMNFQKILHAEHWFQAATAINTKYLWMDENSLMFATNEKYKIGIVSLCSGKKNYNYRLIDLTATIQQIFNAATKSRQFPLLISNFFVMPTPDSTYIFLLSSCGKDHQHQRILYINKITLEIEKWVNLPGEVLEIAVGNTAFYVLIQERLEESYTHNSPSLISSKSNLQKDFSACPFSEPWRGKKFSTKNEIAKTKIIKCTEEKTELFTPYCCSDQLTGIVSTISPDSNRKYESIKEVLSSISKTNRFYVTDDFLYYTNTITAMTHVFGINHHFYLKTLNKDEFILPNKCNMAWFHPTSSIFIQKKNLFYFSIFLHQRASQKEKEEFPIMKCFNYKSDVVFSSSSS